MTTAVTSSRRLPLWAVPLLVLGCGCFGNDSGVKTVPAAGTVTYKGKPVEKGTIELRPVEGGRPATGDIDNGRFTLTTVFEGDGAQPGKHKVAVIATEEVPEKRKNATADTGVKYLIPDVFSNPETSGIVITVPPAGSTKLEITIK